MTTKQRGADRPRDLNSANSPRAFLLRVATHRRTNLRCLAVVVLACTASMIVGGGPALATTLQRPRSRASTRPLGSVAYRGSGREIDYFHPGHPQADTKNRATITFRTTKTGSVLLDLRVHVTLPCGVVGDTTTFARVPVAASGSFNSPGPAQTTSTGVFVPGAPAGTRYSIKADVVGRFARNGKSAAIRFSWSRSSTDSEDYCQVDVIGTAVARVTSSSRVAAHFLSYRGPDTRFNACLVGRWVETGERELLAVKVGSSERRFLVNGDAGRVLTFAANGHESVNYSRAAPLVGAVDGMRYVLVLRGTILYTDEIVGTTLMFVRANYSKFSEHGSLGGKALALGSKGTAPPPPVLFQCSRTSLIQRTPTVDFVATFRRAA